MKMNGMKMISGYHFESESFSRGQINRLYFRHSSDNRKTRNRKQLPPSRETTQKTKKNMAELWTTEQYRNQGTEPRSESINGEDTRAGYLSPRVMGTRPVSGEHRLIRFGRLAVKKEFRIKKETPDDEIKEYAETAMNELLGWYGYDKVDSRDTKGLNLHHFSTNKMPSSGRRSPSDADSSDVEGARSTSPARRDGSSHGSPPLSDSGPVPAGCILCSWCNKIASNKMFSLKTSGGQKSFCSELCFTQCRRANFKRNKTCDWCRHIRHTVNYVDFQDGEHQLQFCSDKCLNQYKMNIFCKETEAHLQLHPHLQETGSAGNRNGNSSVSLITPDLWFRDCRSESPVSDRSASPPDPTLSPLEIKVVVRPPNEVNYMPQKPPPPSLEISKVERRDDAQREKIRKSNAAAKSKRQRNPAPGPGSEHRGSSSPRSGESMTPIKSSLFPPPLLPLGNGQLSHLNALHPNPPLEHPLPRPPFLHLPYLPPQMLPPEHLAHGKTPRYSQMLRPPAVSPPPTPSVNPPPPMAPLPPPRSLLPPVTVLVPYPIALPVPIPLPLPIPIPILSQEKLEATNSECSDGKAEPEATTVPAAQEPVAESNQSVPRPLRKRKRMAEMPQEENINKRKSVPV